GLANLAAGEDDPGDPPPRGARPGPHTPRPPPAGEAGPDRRQTQPGEGAPPPEGNPRPRTGPAPQTTQEGHPREEEIRRTAPPPSERESVPRREPTGPSLTCEVPFAGGCRPRARRRGAAARGAP